MSEFEVSLLDGIVALQLPGRVDVSNARGFVDTLQSELDKDRIVVVLNFEKTEAIDSTALGAIVQVFKTLRARDGSLSLCNVGSGVRRVLAITRVDRVFPIYDTLPAALEQIKKSA